MGIILFYLIGLLIAIMMAKTLNHFADKYEINEDNRIDESVCLLSWIFVCMLTYSIVKSVIKNS